MIGTVLLFQLFLITLTIILHELCHYLTAKLLGYSPKLGFEKNLMPYISFQNKHKDIDNLLIALSAPLGLFGLGFLLPDVPMLQVVKLICMMNIIHVLPIFSDGQVILLSVLNQLRKVSL